MTPEKCSHAKARALSGYLAPGPDHLNCAQAVLVAGLLTVADYLAAYRGLAEAGFEGAEPPAQILVPQESFDRDGLDLARRHFSHLEAATGTKVIAL